MSKTHGLGCESEKLYSTECADVCIGDVVVFSEDHRVLHGMLNPVSDYGQSFDVGFSKKNQILVINGDEPDKNINCMFTR